MMSGVKYVNAPMSKNEKQNKACKSNEHKLLKLDTNDDNKGHPSSLENYYNNYRSMTGDTLVTLSARAKEAFEHLPSKKQCWACVSLPLHTSALVALFLSMPAVTEAQDLPETMQASSLYRSSLIPSWSAQCRRPSRSARISASHKLAYRSRNWSVSSCTEERGLHS